MDSGFFLMHRSIAEWEWYTDTITKVVFLHCLIKANYSDKSWRGIKIERGQFFTSNQKLSEELNLSVKQIRNAISKLVRTNSLAIEGASNGTMITVCNYDKYQIELTEQGQAKRHKKNKSMGNQEASEGQQLNNNNNKEIIYTDEQKSEYEKFNTWLKDKAPRVLQMNSPITIAEFIRLKDDGYFSQEVKKITFKKLIAMENRKDLLKKYSSANLTLRNWCERELEDGKAA